MKNIRFELNGIAYESNDKGTHFYKIVCGKKSRISKDEFEADYELFKREQKVEQDAKTAEKAVAKKRAKKNVAFEYEGITLTEKQVKFLKLLPNDDFFENGLESALWIDVLCDTVSSEFNPMAVGAMISTLREKYLISIGIQRVNGKKCKFFKFTELGKEIAKELGLV